MLAAIDIGALLKVMWAAPLAAISVSVVFSLTIYGATRFSDTRRSGRPLAAGAFGAVAIVSFAAFAAMVILALKVAIEK